MLNDRVPTHAFLAVYPTADVARRVADQLCAQGVSRDAVTIGRPEDVRTSLEAEVQEEITQSFVSPQVGVVYPKETVKAGLAFGPPFLVVGALIGAILGALVPFDVWPLWLEIVVGLIVGATMGGTIAAIVIPAMSVRNPLDLSAADVGVTLRVADGRDVAREILVAARPLRLDRLGAGGIPIDTVVTEEAFTEGGIVEEVVENFAREADAPPERKTR